MNTLFGQSELEKLRDLDYKTESHTFSKGVIAAYYNGLEYPMIVNNNFISIKRKKDIVIFCLKEMPKEDNTGKVSVSTIYTINKTDNTKIKIKEVIYDLATIFTNPTKQVRRGIEISSRKEIMVSTSCDKDKVNSLYNEWYLNKLADPKVYRIAFTPKRYQRSFQLKEKGFNIFEIFYHVKGQLYGAFCYEVQDNIAFELAFISRYWDKKLKLTNDLNELILINSFFELYKRGVKKVNVGPTAGIRGLKIFKAKLPSYEHIIYSN